MSPQPPPPTPLRDRVADLLDLPAQRIGAHDDLIALGLDSIGMMRLATALRRAGVPVGFADLARTPTLAAWADLCGAAPAPPVPAQRRPPVDPAAPFPLALMQHAYWVGRAPDQQLGGVAAHFYHEFDGTDVDPDRLDRAVRALLDRHPMLRVRVGDDGTQRVPAAAAWTGLRVHDLRGATADTARAACAELRRALSHRSLDIAAGEVFDVQLTRLPAALRPGGTRLHVNLDMIAADALSLRVLLRDLAALYRGGELPALPYHFAQYLADRDTAGAPAAREHWLGRLPDLPGPPELPAAAGPVGASRVVRRHRLFDAAARAELDRHARAHGLTLAMALAAAFAETLTGWSAQPRFLLNLPLFDRQPTHPAVDDLVGDFTSSVLLAWDGAAPGDLAARARALQSRFHADAAHHAFSGVEVLRELSRRDGNRVVAPVVYTSAVGLGDLFGADVRDTFGEPSWVISQGPQVWLDAQVTEYAGGLLVNWDAREDAFPPGVLDAMFAAYADLVDGLRAGPAAWTAPPPAVLPAAQRAARAAANATAGPLPGGRLHDAFFRHAAADPDRTALRWGADGRLRYGELAARALAVAGRLAAYGVVPGDLVAVALPKGPRQVEAVLGVLAAGAAYLPIGADQPAARRDRILADAGARLLLTEEHLDRPGQPLPRPRTGDPDALAYVIYTSGSTGAPKGVEVSHAAAGNTVADLNARFGVGPGDRFLGLSALEFDLSVYDILGPLSAGASLICDAAGGRRDAGGWLRLAAAHGATVLNCVPALLDMLLTEAASTGTPLPLRLVLLGGDRVGTDLPGRLRAAAPGCRFAALGGTTETAIHSTVQEVGEPAADWSCVPYGTPLRNVACRVVDALGRDRPDWVPGELWIGGAGVARGYRGDPDRTADRFVPADGVRWYRTGDLARYRPDGTVEFLGRTDHQLKIRGHRIEPGEVEAALRRHPAVTGAVALAYGGRLGAVVTPAGADPAALAAHLAGELPPALRPDRIAAVDALPLTGNGKVDRPALAALLAADAAPAPAGEPPRGPVEERVAAAWRDVLDLPAVGRDDDFFRLGGDSLLATRLVARLRDEGLAGAALSSLFAHPGLAAFATTLATAPAAGAPPRAVPDPAAAGAPFAPTEVQRAYLLGRSPDFPLGGVGCHFYREYDVPDVDVDRLARAIDTVVARHPMLRAVFDADGNQRVLPAVPPFRLTVDDAGPDPAAAFARLRDGMAAAVFDPARWPLFDVRVVRSPAGCRIGVGLDNLILDALSILTFYAELDAAYADPAALPPAPDLSFRDYLAAAAPDDAERAAARAYWADRVPALPPAPQLPLAADPAALGVPRFSRRCARLDPATWRALTDRARAHGLTPSAVLLAAYAEVLGRWSARPDLTLNLTLFDRRDVHPDVDRVLGDFTSLLLIACVPEPGDTWLDRVRRIQAELWGALDHRAGSTVWVLRELARHTGQGDATMPVVFTSALGVAAADRAARGPFADHTWGVSQTPQVWLDHQVVERPDDPAGPTVDLNWDAVDALFPPGLLDDLVAAHRALLGRLAAADWAAPLDAPLPLAQRRARDAANDTAAPVGRTLLHSDFFALAARHPDAPALLTAPAPPAALSYGELADRALRIAGRLAAAGARPGDRVAVSLPKGADQVAAVLGVLAAGAAYLPIGVDQPAPRRDAILAAAGATLALTDAPPPAAGPPAAAGRGAGAAGWPVGVAALSVADALTHPPAPAPAPVDPDDLAYTIFTSGSTGTPKGVDVTHRAAANTVDDIATRYDLGPADRVLALSALDFDLSVFDIAGPLSTGGALVLPAEGERRDAPRWLDLAAAHGVTVWNSVPTLLDMLLVVAASRGRTLPALRLALVSGDWVPTDLGTRLRAAAPAARLVALGGATEAAIWSNAYEGDPPPGWPTVPYGRPLRHQRFRVVDPLGRDCPDWTPGELWIGGAGVARGYVGAPELTAARFPTAGGTRWYRTGDRGRYRPGGLLEILGRLDDQVKVGGHRIEPGEVEAALAAHPAVDRAAVVAVGRDTARRLVGVAVPAAGTGPADPAALRAWLADRLPAHLVPDRLVPAERLPLTRNGKVDRAAVAAAVAAAAGGAAAPLADPLERELAAMWTELLDVADIGADDSFFRLGGDSVRAVRFVELARGRYGVDLPLAPFFAQPTLGRVAAAVRAARPTGPVEDGEV
ncbi:non-ribosomal peptide synthetase [Pilimelia anulata]|uniref:Phenyloxazoline synthase MbtB n=1 Tax=Pilimelia anulata TaxID=53371 RepID=A0A8J3B631_9ACTN|nr:non-ribosomal peptide synthetase [Pilimelia anulata]GGJ75019.1 non-ribosomal peptide synthetase [Pilimelia anulata]